MLLGKQNSELCPKNEFDFFRIYKFRIQFAKKARKRMKVHVHKLKCIALEPIKRLFIQVYNNIEHDSFLPSVPQMRRIREENQGFACNLHQDKKKKTAHEEITTPILNAIPT